MAFREFSGELDTEAPAVKVRPFDGELDPTAPRRGGTRAEAKPFVAGMEALPEPAAQPAATPVVPNNYAERGTGGVLADIRTSADMRNARMAPPVPVLERPATQEMLAAQPAGFTPQEMAEGSIAPWKLEQMRAQQAYGDTTRGPVAKPFDTAQNIAQDVREATPNPVARGAVAGFSNLGQTGVGLVRGAADAVGADGVSQFAADTARTANTIGAGATQGLTGNSKLVADVTASIISSTPAVAIGTIGGPALRTLFAQTAAADYAETGDAAHAGIVGAAEALGERFGFPEQIKLLKGVTKGMPSGDIAKVFGAMIAKEIPGEQLTTALEFLGDKYGPGARTPGATFADYLQQAGDTLAVTIGQTAVMGGGPAAISQTRNLLAGADASVQRSAQSMAQRAATDAGFIRPTERRKQAVQRLEDLVSEHGLPPEAVKAAEEKAATMPLAEVPGFFRRFASALGRRMGRPLDDAALTMLDEPAVPRETKAAESSAAEQPPEAQLADRLASQLGIADTEAVDAQPVVQPSPAVADGTSDGGAPVAPGGAGTVGSVAPDATRAGNGTATTPDAGDRGPVAAGSADATDQALTLTAKPGRYVVSDAISADGPMSESVRLIVRPDGAAAIMRDNGDLIDVTNMVRAGFSAERVIAQSIGDDTTGKNVTSGNAQDQALTPLDQRAHEAATSPLNDRPEPTDAQKEAGNYKVGRVRISGMDVSIENPKGSIRRSKAGDANPWQVEMPAHYGYIRGTEGSDGDHVDLFIGPREDNGRFWIINQTQPDAGTHDEHKVITGVDSADEAVALYKASFADNFGDKVFGSISAEFNPDQLKARLPALKKAKPVMRPASTKNADQPPAQPVAESLAPGRSAEGDGGVAPTQAAGGRIIARAGRSPTATEDLTLRTNQDGTLTPYLGKNPLDDYETGRPIVLPAGTSDLDAKKAIRTAGAVTSKVNFYPATKGSASESRAVMPEGLFVTFGGKTFKVKSIEDAQRKWVQFQETAGAGVSEIGNGVQVVDGAGRVVGRVSYNGRAWDANDNLIAEAPEAGPPPAPPAPPAEVAAAAPEPRKPSRAERARARMAVDPATDSMLQALAKLGGIRRDVVAREFGLKPEELKHTVTAGGLRAYPFRLSGGRDLDSAMTALREVGYFTGVADEDVRTKFEEAIYNELGGGKELTPQGQMRRGQDEAQQRAEQEAQAQAELDAENDTEAKAEREAIMAEAGMSERVIATATDDDIDLMASNVSTERAMQALGFTDQEIADELARQAKRNPPGGAAEDATAAQEEAPAAGGTGGAEAGAGAAGSEEANQRAAELIGAFRARFAKAPSGMTTDEFKTFARERREASDKINGEVLELAQKAGILLLPQKWGNGFISLHADPRTDGAWRITRFTDDMEPSGHMEFNRPVEAAAQMVSDGQAAEPRPDLTLESPTKDKVLAQQAAIEQEQADREAPAEKPKGHLTGEQVDAFNTQGSVFDQPAEPEQAAATPPAEPPHFAEIRNQTRAYWDATAIPAIREYLHAFDAFGADRLERNRIKPEGMSAREWLESFVSRQSTWDKGRKTGQTGIQYLGTKDLWPTEDGSGERLRKTALEAVKALKNAPSTTGELMAEAFMERKAAPGEAFSAADDTPRGLASVDGGGSEADTSRYASDPDRNHLRIVDFARESIAKRRPGFLLRAVEAPGSRSDLRAARAVARGVAGHKVIFVKQDNGRAFNGAAFGSPGHDYLLIDVDSSLPVMAVTGHEMLHRLRAARPDLYEALDKRIRRVLQNESAYAKQLRDRYERLQLKPLSEDKIHEELIADIFGDEWSDPEFWRELAKDKPQGFRAIVDAVVKFLDDMIAKVVKTRPFGTETYLTDLRAARDAVMEATREFSKGEVGNLDTVPSDLQFSTPANPVPPAETRARAFQRKVQDQFNRFTVIRDWAKDQGLNMTPDSNVWAYEERMHGRIATRVEDFREKTLKPKIQAIQKAGFTMEQVAEFLHAQHAEERNKQIESIDPTNTAGSGMDTAKAKAILAAADPKLAALANDFRKITEDTKAILLRAGIINKDMTDAWEAAYKNYVPLKGSDEAAQAGTGRGLSASGKQKRAMGHGERSEHIIENILRDHERAITVAEKNLVGHSLLTFVADLANPDIATIGQPEKRKVLKNSTEYEVLDGSGARLAIFDSLEGANKFIAKHSQPGLFGSAAIPLTAHAVRGDPQVAFMSTPMLADNEVNVYVKGHAVRVQLNDDLLARAYTRSGVEALNQLMAMNREINAYFSKVYTGYNPEFLFTNMARDWTTGLINVTGQYGIGIAAKASADYPRAFASLLRYGITGKATPDIQQYRDAGGSTGAAYLSDIERIGRDVEGAYDEYRGVIATAKNGGGIRAGRAAARKFVGHLLGWMEHINAAGENAMRLAVFEAVRDTKGFTVNDAASAAKNSTVNFNRRGEWGHVIGAMYLFFNPAIQGTAAIADALVNGKHKAQALALTGSLTALAYFAAAGQFGGGDDDDEAWDAIPDSTKDKNIVIRTGAKTYVTIPIPYGYGFFYSLGNAVHDWTKGRRDKDKIALNVASNLLEHFSPIGNPLGGDKPDARGLVELIPGAIGGELMRDAIRLAANRSSLGGDIIPDSPFDQGKPDHLRLFRSTKGTVYDKAATAMSNVTGGTKSLPGGIDVSPETLKFWTRAVTGGAGMSVVDTLNATRRFIAKQDKTLTPEERQALESRPEEIPIIRRFAKEERVQDKRRQFWDAVEHVKEAQADLARARKLYDEAGEERVYNQRGELIAMGAYTASLTKMVKAQRDLVDEVMTDETTSLAYKRARVKVLEQEEATIYGEYIKEFAAERQKAKAERAAKP